MHQFLYISEARAGLAADDTFRIIEQSARNNSGRDITGFLFHGGNLFLQLIEGPLENLRALISTLERDDRHHSIRILHDQPITARAFPRWRMQRVGASLEDLREVQDVLRKAGLSFLLPQVIREVSGASAAA